MNAKATQLESIEPSEDGEGYATLQRRQQRLMDLLGTKDPAKLEHDLRNVLNELALLRKLTELED